MREFLIMVDIIQNYNQSPSTVPVLIVVGEISGDIFASELMEEINKKQPCRFIGMGGKLMRESGLESICPDNTLRSTVGGFLEALPTIFSHLINLYKIVPTIRQHNIKHVILVDFELFSILAAKKIRKAFGKDIKIYFYIAPRVSMWGKKTAPVVASLADKIFCYMESDLDIYKQYTENAFYFGNPLKNRIINFKPDPLFGEKHNLSEHKQYMALMPGSRTQEINRMLDIFLSAARRLHIERNIEFLMSIAHPHLTDKIRSRIKKFNLEDAIHIIKVPNAHMEIMHYSSLGIVSAGTVTLEAVMMKMYPIICYKISEYSFQHIKKSENLSDDTLVGLPNVFLKEHIFPEILQSELTPERLYQESMYILDMKKELFHHLMENTYNQLNIALGNPDAVVDTADSIVDSIKMESENNG